MSYPRSPLKRKGIAYERKVNFHLMERFGLTSYIPSQWFKYQLFHIQADPVDTFFNVPGR